MNRHLAAHKAGSRRPISSSTATSGSHARSEGPKRRHPSQSREARTPHRDFRTGTMESFGLGYDVLSASTPPHLLLHLRVRPDGPRRTAPGTRRSCRRSAESCRSRASPTARRQSRRLVSRPDDRDLLRARHLQPLLTGRRRPGQRVDGSLGTAVTLLTITPRGFSHRNGESARSSHPSLAPYRNSAAVTAVGVYRRGHDRSGRLVAGSTSPRCATRSSPRTRSVRHPTARGGGRGPIGTYDPEPL